MYIILYKETVKARWRAFRTVFTNKTVADSNSVSLKNRYGYYKVLVRFVEEEDE